MTTNCPTCNTPWTDHLGIAGTCARLKAAEQERDKLAEQLWSARNAFEALARGACGAPPRFRDWPPKPCERSAHEQR